MNKQENIIKVEPYYDEQYKKNTEIVGNIVVPIIVFIFLAPIILGPLAFLYLYIWSLF